TLEALPVMRLSMAVTRAPASTRAVHTWLPRKPAPPSTTACLPSNWPLWLGSLNCSPDAWNTRLSGKPSETGSVGATGDGHQTQAGPFEPLVDSGQDRRGHIGQAGLEEGERAAVTASQHRPQAVAHAVEGTDLLHLQTGVGQQPTETFGVEAAAVARRTVQVGEPLLCGRDRPEEPA